MLKKIKQKQKLKIVRWIFGCAFGMILCVDTCAAEGSAKFYNAQGRRDPFVPLVAGGVRTSGGLASVEMPEDLVLEGIVLDSAGSFVVANGAMLREGETVGNIKVLHVETSKATLEVNGVETVKEIYPNPAGGQ